MINLTEGHEGKRLLFFALPIFIGNILQQLYNTVDAVIVGRCIGPMGLAAVGVSSPLMFLQIALLIGIGCGVEILIARYVGKEDNYILKKASDSLLTTILILSVIIAVTGYFISKPLLKLIGTPDDILDQAIKYLRIIFIGLPGMAGYNTLSGMVRSTGNSILPLKFLLVATVMNITLDILFIYYYKLWIAGAAYATITAQSCAFILFLIYINTHELIIKYNPLRIDFGLEMVKKGFKLGMPASIQHGAVSMGMILLQAIVNPLGSKTIAAYSIGMKIDSFASLPIVNLSQAITMFTSQNLGAGKVKRILKGKRTAMTTGYVICGLLFILIWLAGSNIVRVFTTDIMVVKMAVDYLRVLSLAYFLATYFTIIHGVIRGTGNTLVPMLIVLMGHWIIRLPLAQIMSRSMGYMGIWISIPIGWVVAFLATFIYYRSKLFKINYFIKSKEVTIFE